MPLSAEPSHSAQILFTVESYVQFGSLGGKATNGNVLVRFRGVPQCLCFLMTFIQPILILSFQDNFWKSMSSYLISQWYNYVFRGCIQPGSYRSPILILWPGLNLEPIEVTPELSLIPVHFHSCVGMLPALYSLHLLGSVSLCCWWTFCLDLGALNSLVLYRPTLYSVFTSCSE